jgi:anti-sigma factor RsiW
VNHHWHEQIQRYVNGQASAEEAAALQAALKQDAELRALYLDYMNLDVALGAAAELAAIPEDGIGRITTITRPPARPSRHYWRWLAATAAGAALAMFALRLSHRNPSPTSPDFAATISSTKNAIARLSVDTASSLPAWMSPTASLLEPPGFPPRDPRDTAN